MIPSKKFFSVLSFCLSTVRIRSTDPYHTVSQMKNYDQYRNGTSF